MYVYGGETPSLGLRNVLYNTLWPVSGLPLSLTTTTIGCQPREYLGSPCIMSNHHVESQPDGRLGDL